MAVCELCGRSAELVSTEIEQVELMVCAGCTKHGPPRKKPTPQSYNYSSRVKELPAVRIVSHFASLIKTAREKQTLNREDFARFLNEKESTIAGWEQGMVKPTIEAAQRLEKKLGMIFIEHEYESDAESPKKQQNDTLTLGDFVVIKRRNA